MIRTLMLNDQPVELNSSMGWLYIYQRQFGHDILPDIMPLIESVVAGFGDVLDAVVTDDQTKDDELSAKEALALMNSDNIVDMFIKLSGMELTTILNILWAMVKNANPATPDPQKYANSFDRMPLVDELAPALLYIILDSSSSSKNAKSLLAKLEKAIPSVSTLLPSPESTEGCE